MDGNTNKSADTGKNKSYAEAVQVQNKLVMGGTGDTSHVTKHVLDTTMEHVLGIPMKNVLRTQTNVGDSTFHVVPRGHRQRTDVGDKFDEGNIHSLN